MEENNVKPANEVSILSEKIETTSMPVTSGISESNVDLTSMSENDNIIKGKCSSNSDVTLTPTDGRWRWILNQL